MPPLPFEQLGPYRIERVLGRGGMGTVFAAMNTQTEEPAAVKVLSTGLADDESFRERFIAEIESLKKLDHPHIVRLYGYGREDDHLFYAMELVEGISLEHELSQGRRFDWREVTRISIDICRALKHAHDHGVIHRDLKPANLLLDAAGKVKLLDFGIAKLFGVTNLTASGNVLGTADYMAPEQARGKSSTPRCDLYSLGSVMYALLCGHPPFRGQTIAEVVHKLQVDEPTPIQRLAPDTPDELARIIHELLQKSPNDRIPTALALSHRLKAMELALTSRATGAPMGVPLGSSNSPSALTRKIPRPPVGHRLDDQAPTRINPAVGPDIASRTTVSLPHGSSPIASVAGQPTRVQSTEMDQLDVDLHDQVEPAPKSGSGETDGPADKRTHFTHVEPRSSRSVSDEETPASHGIVVAIAAVALMSLITLVWYQTKPPTADALFARIDAAITQDQPEKMLAAESLLARFLNLYPNDPRAERVADYIEQTELYRLQRQYEARARRGLAGSGLSPAEQHYLAALRQASTDPEEAIQRMQGLIDMYADSQGDSIQTRRCIDLAKKQIEHLRRAAVENATHHRNLLRERLAAGRQLAESDPVQARGIYDGIVALYGRSEWAREFVQQARALREQLRIPPISDSAVSVPTPPPDDVVIPPDSVATPGEEAETTEEQEPTGGDKVN
jgi:serine/threonine-protein kinase